MHFISSLLIASALFAVSNAACQVCSCAAPATFTKEYFDSKIAPTGEDTLEDFTFVAVNKVSVVGCTIELDCTFGDLSGSGEARRVAVGPDGELTSNSNLKSVTCNNGKWMLSSGEIQNVGCFVSSPM